MEAPARAVVGLGQARCYCLKNCLKKQWMKMKTLRVMRGGLRGSQMK